MNLDELHRKLIAAAKANPPSDRVPFAFEKRITARLAGRHSLANDCALWAQALWRATVPCVAVMLLLSAWSFLGANTPPSTDLSQDIENTVLAAVDQEQSPDSSW